MISRGPKDLSKRPLVPTTASWMLPNLIKLEVHLPMGTLVIYDTNIPVSPTETKTFWVSLRTFFIGKWADKNAAKRVLPVFIADAAIVENQRPELLPFDLSDELHTRSDQISVYYRRRLAELEAEGNVYRWDGEVLPGLRPELVSG